ncbi:MAG TPA: biotin/lipoyl-containing protein, partial [Aquihabitans sp.]|nr:biotin/lipoyl-containing protein [Aquihabitans sp.]
MPTSVTMPALGESVTEGTVTRWLKQEGEQVQADEPLLEVSTDKVDTEIPSPAAGVLTKILVAEDETVEVGAELAVIGGGDDGGGDGAAAPPASAEDAEGTPQTPVDQVEDAGPGGSDDGQQVQQDAAPAPAQPAGDAGDGSAGGGEGTAVTMPALGESVTEGTVTRWLKSVGDEITADEPLLEVSTDKVDTEIPAPVSGTLLSITVQEDETVEVGAELAVIGAAGGGAAPEQDAQPAPQQEAPQQEAPQQEAP